LYNINLVEWETLRPSEASFLGSLVPSFDKRSERIVEELAASDKLEIVQFRSGVQVRATSWVGRVTLGDLTITVRPKIAGAPLLNLLRYAYSLRDLETFTPTGYKTEAEAVQDLIVEQLATEAAELLSRGLHRDYLRFDADLVNPTGRINFGRLVQACATAKSSVLCTYHNRSEAVLLNRVLLAGLRLAERASTDAQLCGRVFRMAQILEASVPAMQLSKADLDNARRLIDRRSTAYSSALTLIEMLVNGMGVSIEEGNDTVHLSGFLFDMNAFFQALISRFLHEELPEFAIQDEHRLKEIFEYDRANNPQRRRAVVPRPDFAVLARGKVIEFLDAKYRDLWERRLPREMLYQLAIYALSKNAGKPRSTILYPTLAVDSVDQVVLLKDPIVGNKRAEIVLRPVNLLQMEALIRPRQSALVARKRQQFARNLVFGAKTASAPTSLQHNSEISLRGGFCPTPQKGIFRDCVK
jgi:5-methylcytosine-specific restriction enzyme subunit McrC